MADGGHTSGCGEQKNDLSGFSAEKQRGDAQQSAGCVENGSGRSLNITPPHRPQPRAAARAVRSLGAPLPPSTYSFHSV